MSDLHSLYERLERAERSLAFADMIDDFVRRDQQVEYWRAKVTALKRQIEQAETGADDPFNPQGSGPAPIEPREG